MKLLVIPVAAICVFGFNWKLTEMTCQPVVAQGRGVTLDSGIELVENTHNDADAENGNDA